MVRGGRPPSLSLGIRQRPGLLMPMYPETSSFKAIIKIAMIEEKEECREI